LAWNDAAAINCYTGKSESSEHKGLIRDAVAATALEILSTPFTTLLYDLDYLQQVSRPVFDIEHFSAIDILTET